MKKGPRKQSPRRICSLPDLHVPLVDESALTVVVNIDPVAGETLHGPGAALVGGTQLLAGAGGLGPHVHADLAVDDGGRFARHVDVRLGGGHVLGEHVGRVVLELDLGPVAADAGNGF